MSLVKYFRSKAYQWHCITSLAVAIPVLLWTISGFMHPVMNSMKPKVRNHSLQAPFLDTTRIRLSIHEALRQNNIAQINRFRVVKLYEVFYYQVKQPGIDTLTLINCSSGTVLLNGDRIYATHLAQRFLSDKNGNVQQDHGHHGINAALIQVVRPENGGQQTKNSGRVKEVKLLTRFDEEYKASNKILPVYRVSFERADNIRLYIETPADRLALAVDDRKAWFSRFFGITHSWSFLNGMGKIKSALLGVFSLLCFCSGLLGFYVYYIIKSKPGKRQKTGPARAAHLVLGNLFLATTLLYAFSGAWHAFQKLVPKPAVVTYLDETVFAASELKLPFKNLTGAVPAGRQLHDLSVVQVNDTAYWQLTIGREGKKEKHYLNTSTLRPLHNGDVQYGCYLACKLSGRQHRQVTHSSCLTAFNNRYSMMNKRLPVIEVNFDNAETFFVETATGTLSAITTPAGRAERFSFSNLHLHHYWEMWMGKETGTTLRNFVLIASTLGMLLAALTGITVWLQRKNKKNLRETTSCKPRKHNQ